MRNTIKGKNTRVFARRCLVKHLSDHEASQFLDRTHLHKGIEGCIHLALTFNDVVVEVMSFKSSENSYELIRLSSELNTTVVGGASKLLTYFEREYTPTIITSTTTSTPFTLGTIYDILGFTKDNDIYIKEYTHGK